MAGANYLWLFQRRGFTVMALRWWVATGPRFILISSFSPLEISNDLTPDRSPAPDWRSGRKNIVGDSHASGVTELISGIVVNAVKPSPGEG